MSVAKKSFVVYFDSYPLLAGLSMEQRGLLFSAQGKPGAKARPRGVVDAHTVEIP